MATPGPRQTFVGRETELGVLREAFAACDTGASVTLLVEAESGMGKSALVEQFIAGLDRREVIVLRGRCYERESVPYKGRWRDRFDQPVRKPRRCCRFTSGSSPRAHLVGV